MEDWQGCLAPQCQTALANARNRVFQRGGVAITVEDFILALLDDCPALNRFLGNCGIDLDELTRTVQCEQPIITGVSAEGLLSNQLVYWFATARELNDAPWLDWPVLLQILTHKAERLQEKAYVAVLELVSAWPASAADVELSPVQSAEHTPIVLAQTAWVELARSVALEADTNPASFIWLKAPRGSGKSCWLESLLPLVGIQCIRLNLRCEREVVAAATEARQRLRPLHSLQQSPMRWPMLIMDNTSPRDLLRLAGRPGSAVGDVLAVWGGPILLLADDRASGRTVEREQLRLCLGRSLQTLLLPPCNVAQLEGIIVARQPAIERRWNVELEPAVINFAVAQRHLFQCCPGPLLMWLERAAARLNVFAQRGSSQSAALTAQAKTVECQRLVAQARDGRIEPLNAALVLLSQQQDRADSDWQQRRAAGTLRKLCVEDLPLSLQWWLAAN